MQYFDDNLATYTAGFDDIGRSMLTTFQCTTIAGWSYVMYRVTDRYGRLASLYFVVLVIFGSYFVVSATACRRSLLFEEGNTVESLDK